MHKWDKGRLDRLEALGVKAERATPPGQPKMSAVILELVQPLLEQHGKSAEKVEALISLAVAGWNKSLLPADLQPAIETELINGFVPRDGSAEAVGVAIDLMDHVADRRAKLYPNLRKLIVDYEVIIANGQLTLNVLSAPIPERR